MKLTVLGSTPFKYFLCCLPLLACNKDVENEVVNDVPVEIVLNETTLELKVGETYTLSTIPNLNDITWSSTDVNIIEVDGSGKITANAGGEVQVIAKRDNSEAICEISVIPDIFISGSEYAGVNNTRVAKYWKNGQAVSLTDGVNESFATSISVIKGNIHVSGWEVGNQDFHLKYWMNDEQYTLATVSSGGFGTR